MQETLNYSTYQTYLRSAQNRGQQEAFQKWATEMILEDPELLGLPLNSIIRAFTEVEVKYPELSDHETISDLVLVTKNKPIIVEFKYSKHHEDKAEEQLNKANDFFKEMYLQEHNLYIITRKVKKKKSNRGYHREVKLRIVQV